MSLPPLRRALLSGGHRFSAAVAVSAPASLPEKVVQFGEGNFLRAFVDWMIDRMNGRGLFQGRAVLVQPIAAGLAEKLNAQDGLYTVVLRGIEGGKVVESRQLVSAVSRAIDPYANHRAYLDCAGIPELRFVVSNTTEAGIRTEPADTLEGRPPVSFPGKLTQLLYERFRRFQGDPGHGLVMLPCELIERNGDALARAVRETAERWALPTAFLRWVDGACLFTNTLVDRIVTGYPKEEAAALAGELGYRDDLLVAGEIFHSWVIESPRPLEEELPLRAAGLEVIWTNDVTPYRERKVRILNGAHTMTALAAYLAGKETVGDCLADATVRRYLERGLYDEILPTLTSRLPRRDVETFAGQVLERFSNPFIKHQLTSIALNSVSKYKARILGTVRDFAASEGRLPRRLVFALAALCAYYRGGEIRNGALVGRRGETEYLVQDEPGVLAAFLEAWQAAGARPDGAACLAFARRVLGRSDLWGDDLTSSLPGIDAAVAEHLAAICEGGMPAALGAVA